MDKSVAELQKIAKDAGEAARRASEDLRMAQDREREERRAPLKALVKRAHACLCRWNHTDGCGWSYEGDNWDSHAHYRWLAHYDRIINGDAYNKPTTTMEEVETIIGMAESLKPKLRTGLWLLRGALEP